MPSTTELGLFILRVSVGMIFFTFVYPQFLGSREGWAGSDRVGAAMERLGTQMAEVGVPKTQGKNPQTVGTIASILILVATVLFILGPLFPYVGGFLVIVAATTTLHLIRSGAPYEEYSYPLWVTMVALGTTLLGPGKFLRWRMGK